MGTGTLALAVPLAWPAGAAGQHLDVPSASSVRSGLVQLADWVTRDGAPAPAVPVQQSGTAAGQKRVVPVSQTQNLKHASGHAPGKGKGQLPQWSAHGPAGSASGTFTSRPAVRGFNASTSTLVASGATARSDLYKNADGSYTRKVWPGVVNYKTASGSWAPVDDTLVRGSAGRWQEKANSLGVSFASAGDDQSLAELTIPGGTQQVSFSLAGAGKAAASASGSSVVYAKILPGTDVTESAGPSGISETLTLDSAAAGNSWVFPLTLKGLTASISGDSVDLSDASGKVVAVIPPAVARSGPVNLATPDSQASSQLTYQLVTDNGSPALKMTLDKGWLDAPGRVFPVVVDPTVSQYPPASTFVEQQNSTNETANNSTSEFLPAGTVTQSGIDYHNISFLDFSSFNANFKDDYISAASLHMFDVWGYQCTYTEEEYAYQVTQDWHPSVATTYPGPAYGTKDAQWTGIAPSRACSNTSGNPGQGGWISLTFNSAGLSLLNNWTLSNTIGNYGFAVAPSLTDEQMFKQFDSNNDGNLTSSQGGDCTGNCRPYLSLTYTTTGPPQITSQYPPTNYNSPTLTPQLIATGQDLGNLALQYQFSVYTSTGALAAQSAKQSSGKWTVPAGDLQWGQTYHWTVQDFDAAGSSPVSPGSFLSTPVPQPLVSSRLSQNASGPGFDPESGNWTTSATDAQVATVGPPLEITRDYNSADPWTSGAFGAGWSSVLDMKVSPGEANASGTTQTEIVTYPDGKGVAYGLNPGTSGTYSAPPGRFATLATVSTGGFKLTDKNDTQYLFTEPLTSGGYGITSITDALGRAETFTWNSSAEITSINSASGRTLTVSWASTSGAYPHVVSVVTNDATANDASTAQDWTYDYSGDDLTAACPPASTTACTAYTYTSGSDYPQAVLNSGPQSYWRLDDTSGSAATSSVLANEGSDNGTYEGVTLGASGGPLAGSSATVASFNGTSSHVTLQPNLVSASSYQTISMWFKTTTPDGVLFSSSSGALSATTSGSYSPELYVGSDGKLLGAFWDGNASDVISTSSAVDDGQWHNAVLADSASGQELYLDGVKVGQLSKGFASNVQSVNYVGAGFLGGSWPDESHYDPGVHTGYATYFTGDIADVALWGRQLTGSEAQAMYAAGASPAALLTKETQPSGDVSAQVTYDPVTGRVTSDTDNNGGTWHVAQPAVAGSSLGYVASVLGAHPTDYWRLNDTGATSAADMTSCDCDQSATYYDVTEGVSGGPFADQPVAQFNGNGSYLSLPLTAANSGKGTLGVWFKTSGTDQVLYSEESGPVTGSAPAAYDPVLYVGNDGKLNAEFWDGSINVVTSTAAVNDGDWHYAVLSAGSGSQSLYVDGSLQGTSTGNLVTPSAAWTNVTAGAGFLGGSWPDIPSSTVKATWFSGEMAELAWYPGQLSASQVSAQWDAAQSSTGLIPLQTETVTDPGNHTLTYKYDLQNNGRTVSQTDAAGVTTTYGYDTGGFRDEVDVAGITDTQTGYDPRGNKVSQTTCQDQEADKCSTSYWTYYPDDTSAQLTTPDPRNDMVLTYADGRSASSTDTTYQTKYTYDPAGELTSETSPPVAGYPSGRTTTTSFTDGTTSAGGYDSVVPPAGLPYKETTPGGAVTTTLYYQDGDVAQVTGPDGQRTVYGYDLLGRKTSRTVYSDTYPAGLKTTYSYDANGDLATETGPAVTDRVTGAVHTPQTTTSYDADGNVTSQTIADTTGGDASRTTTRTYNDYDQLQSETDPDNATTTYTYDAYGNVASETDPDGNVTAYTYDGDGNLLTTTLENYTGSPSGSQTAAPLVEESRSYDSAGRLASVTDAMGRATEYTYLDNGLVATKTKVSPDKSQSFTTESYSYDGAGNVTAAWTNNKKTETTSTYDAAGRLTQQVVDPSGLDRSTSITYTPDDKQASVTRTGADGASQTTSYTYDPAGNKLSQTVTDPGAGGPAAWFSLSQSSGTTVPDGVSGGQSATASGVTWNGSEGAFSGTSGSQVVTAGPVVDTTGSFTVAANVNLTTTGSGDEAVLSQAAGTGNGFTLQYDPATGDWEFARSLTDTAGASSAVAGSGANATAATGTSTSLIATYDANTGTMTLYVNGVSAGTATDATPISAHSAFTIASAKTNGAQGDWFDGQISDVQVYPRALPAAQVSQLYGMSSGVLTTGALTTTWTRDQRGLPTSMTDPDGAVTDYSYDEAGKLAVTTDPMVTTQTYGSTPVTARPVATTGYDTFGDVAESEDSDGNITTYAYDGDGQQVSKTLPPYTPPGGSPVTAVDTTKYDPNGQVTSTTDALGNTTTYAYDQLGNRTSVTEQNGSQTSTSYDADGEALSVTGPTGAVTDSTYDYLGRVSTATQVERYTASGSVAYTTSSTYNDATGGGWLSKQTSSDGVSSSYTYDAAGARTSVTDGAGDKTSYSYDALGRRAKVTFPDGSATATGYDAAGNVVSTSNLDASGNVLATTTAAFDGEGDQVSATNADGDSAQFTYDPTGMVTQEVQPVSATTAVTTSFGYDAAGNRTLYTDGDGSQWWDTYNTWGLQESRVEPATSQYSSAADSTFTTSYDADQNPVTETEPGGVTVTSTYNNVNELTGQSATGADAATPTRSFGYDAAGNVTSAGTSNTAGSGSNATSESFTYNDRGQVLTSSGAAGSSSYAYNGDGQVTSVADAAGTTSYAYDTAGRLASLANPVTGTTATYAYNSDSQVSQVSYGSGGDTESYAYDGQRRLTSDTLKTAAGATVASQGYGYDAAGNITAETTSGLAGPASSTFTYDEAGRLTSWDNGTATTTYGYDANGNLTWAGATARTYDARDELTSDGTSSYGYTARGTPAQESTPSGAGQVSFDAYGDQAAAGTRSYTYDALGRLTADTVSGAGYQFSYAGSSGTLASDGTWAYAWDPSGGALVAEGPAAGGGTLVLADSHGDVTGQFTAAGSTVSGSQAYDPWGKVTAASGTLQGLLGFQSAWGDPATGKSLMGARWYSSAAGGFTSADTAQVSPVPDPAAGNPFAYAADSPLTGVDPSGHRALNLPGDYAGAGGTAAAVISQAHEASYYYGQYEQEQRQAQDELARARAERDQAALQAARRAAARAAAARAAARAHQAARAAAARAAAHDRAVYAARVAAARAAAIHASAVNSWHAAREARIDHTTLSHTTLNPADVPTSTASAPGASGGVACDTVESRYAVGPCQKPQPSAGGGGTSSFADRFWNGVVHFVGSATGITNDVQCVETGDWVQCAEGVANGAMTVVTILDLGTTSGAEAALEGGETVLEESAGKVTADGGENLAPEDAGTLGESGRFRTVYRGDRRSPDEIRAAGGFEPRGTSTDLRSYARDNTPSVYVGTSRRSIIARNFVARKGGWVYKISAPADAGVNVNRALFPHVFWYEREWAYPGGVPADWIQAVRPSRLNSWLGPWQPFGE